MFEARERDRKLLLAAGIALFMLAPAYGAQAKKPFQVLYTFGESNGGLEPLAPLARDKAGNLYGTTYGTDSESLCDCGTVFMLAPDGTANVLHAFSGGEDGSHPLGGVVLDKAGNIYGTTEWGGQFLCGNQGCGTVFKITPDGTKSILHSFNGADGQFLLSGLLLDKTGNLYGTTQGGGAFGQGTVFELHANGVLTTLHSFDIDDGATPEAGLIADMDGNLYGTTLAGGPSGRGTVFRLAPDGTETVLQGFTTGGLRPQASLLLDSAGNLYGTTTQGGGVGCPGVGGCGVAFKVTPDGTETVLHAFGGGSDGSSPLSNLVADKSGNLYGTTYFGGNGACGNGCGTVFKIDPQGNETVIQLFSKKNGALPAAGLIIDKKGHLYGTTSTRGPQQIAFGTVFEITP